MRVLFDHGAPAPLARALDGYDVRFAKSEGWDTFANGALLAAAEAGGAIVVLLNAQWPVLRQHVHRVRAAVDAAAPGGYVEVASEDDRLR